MSILTVPIEFMGRTHRVEYRPDAFRSSEVIALLVHMGRPGPCEILVSMGAEH